MLCEFGVLGLLLLTLLKGENICKNYNVGSINLTAELQSDVLLPCNFKPVLHSSNETSDVSAIWTHKNDSISNLLEVTLQGEITFWNHKGGRIKTFPNLSESGNFSILLYNVQLSDLGFYCCELFKGRNCSIAYQEMQLAFETKHTVTYWYYLLGAAAVLTLLLACWSCVKCRRSNSAESFYMNAYFHQNRRATIEEAIYVNDTNLRKMKASKTHGKSSVARTSRPSAPLLRSRQLGCKTR
ncbi:uncharacterized protein LOC143503291 isoform X2 [Brachyhypopomus gauderio]|uniref:uncharacterized protein LOC143503291 isoform X2 n=1 Tax=Brachyhypopomus gauderio TaxID=698409 RepID=UPI004041889E